MLPNQDSPQTAGGELRYRPFAFQGFWENSLVATLKKQHGYATAIFGKMLNVMDRSVRSNAFVLSAFPVFIPSLSWEKDDFYI
jgi:hypothetical protein